MKTIKKFIEDGFKGGFEYRGLKAEHGIKVKQAAMDDNWHIYATKIKAEPMYTVDTERLLMMPKLWIAVGRHRKWSEPQMAKTIYEDQGLELQATGSFAQQMYFLSLIVDELSFEDAMLEIEK